MKWVGASPTVAPLFVAAFSPPDAAAVCLAGPFERVRGRFSCDNRHPIQFRLVSGSPVKPQPDVR